MDKIYLRADDFDLSNILSYFIERDIDKKNIAILSNDQPVLLVGSRGTGKTMLMRVTAKKLHKAFKKNRVLPVYLSLSSCAIISNQNFRRWVLHEILLYLDTALREEGFFDLFKDLRSPKIVCKASVYPGLVSFGNFQQSHDITQKIIIERRCDDPNYVQDMRKIIEVYFKERYKELLKTGEILNCLIYCATGNPRFLIKTIELSLKNGQRLKTETTKDILKDYYRNELWQEHRKLAEKYSGHKHLINWGDEFISDKVISELTAKNTTPDKSSIYFGVAINSPSTVIHSLKILEYSGIIFLDSEATRYRKDVYNRYSVNIGMYLTKQDSFTLMDYKDLIDKLSSQNYMTYNKNSSHFDSILNLSDLSDMDQICENTNEVLRNILDKSLEELELTAWTKHKLISNNYTTIKSLLEVEQSRLREIERIGDVRATNIKNEAYNAILEYISG